MNNMQIYIVPTYDCNLDCKNCYSKKYLGDFPDYLSWENFVKIFNHCKDNYRNFAFIGGEPTKWKFINEAILFLINKNKNVSIFTNGTIPLSVSPNNLIINGNNIINSEVKNTIIKNLSIYKENKTKIRLRFNIDETFDKDYINEAVSLSSQYANSVSISMLYPIKYSKQLGKIVFDFSTQLVSESIPVKISRATPLCLFSQEQRAFLIENCKLKGTCSLPTNSLVVNPDGQTIQPCVELKMKRNISELSKTSPINLFRVEINNIKSNRKAECSDCHFLSNGECLGGCLSYTDKFNTKLEKELPCF
jgi:MoaA/NifB/PqqE/SkfB family radical SAM enzyme